jgi:3-methyladenine DNA glycosylase/8-oxoguanine DNA glycosylase
MSGEFRGDEIGDRRLVAGDAGDRIEAAEEFRQLIRHGAYPTRPGGYGAAVRVDLPEPYDFHRSTFRFRTFGRDAASVWHDGGLYRVLRSGRAVRISADGARGDGPVGAGDREEVLHLLGAEFDLAAFAAAQPRIAARAPGLRPPLLADAFEALVTFVTAQQVSLLAACAIRGRFVRRFGRRAELDGVEVWAFPRQAAVAGAKFDGVGLSQAKIRAITALAEADLDLTGLDDDAVRRRLLALPGIGGWTVDWFMARCLGRPDAFAPGDLGVRKAVARWFSDDPIWPEQRVREACSAFGIHANLAVHYLLAPADE